MTSLLRLFGFPPPERRDSVRFHFVKNLPYNARVVLAVLLLITGFALQLYSMKALYGAPLVFFGICLVLVKGYDSRLRIKGFSQDINWKTVEIEKIREIEVLRKKKQKMGPGRSRYLQLAGGFEPDPGRRRGPRGGFSPRSTGQ